jgi:hypothetical protein
MFVRLIPSSQGEYLAREAPSSMKRSGKMRVLDAIDQLLLGSAESQRQVNRGGIAALQAVFKCHWPKTADEAASVHVPDEVAGLARASLIAALGALDSARYPFPNEEKPDDRR